MRYFYWVAQEKSFTRAAEEIHVSQPSLSKQIAKLEAELGVRLLNRLGRRVELTRAGQILFEHAERILAEIDQAVKEIGAHLHAGRVEVRLGAVPTVSDYILPSILKAFLQRHPAVNVHVQTAATQQLVEALLAGQLDAAIVTLPVKHPRIRQEFVFDDEFVLTVPSDHPWSGREAVELAELSGQPLVVPPKGRWFDEVIEPACRKHNVRLWIRAETRNYEAIKELALSGVGLGLVTQVVMRRSPKDLRTVRIRHPRLTRRIAWISVRDQPRPEVVEQLRIFLADQLSDPSADETRQP